MSFIVCQCYYSVSVERWQKFKLFWFFVWALRVGKNQMCLNVRLAFSMLPNLFIPATPPQNPSPILPLQARYPLYTPISFPPGHPFTYVSLRLLTYTKSRKTTNPGSQGNKNIRKLVMQKLGLQVFGAANIFILYHLRKCRFIAGSIEGHGLFNTPCIETRL